MKTFTFNDRYEFYERETEVDIKVLREQVFSSITSRLKQAGSNFNLNSIGLSDAGHDGHPCIHDEDGFWVVYIAERGRRSSQAVFVSANDAADYFVWMLTR